MFYYHIGIFMIYTFHLYNRHSGISGDALHAATPITDDENDMIPITTPETLGKILRRYRKELGLTQSEAGKKFNLSQKTVSQVEAGVSGIQLGTLFKLMSALALEMHLEPRSHAAQKEPLW